MRGTGSIEMTRKNDRLFSSTKVHICFISTILFTSFFSLVSAFLSIEYHSLYENAFLEDEHQTNDEKKRSFPLVIG